MAKNDSLAWLVILVVVAFLAAIVIDGPHSRAVNAFTLVIGYCLCVAVLGAVLYLLFCAGRWIIRRLR